jgi:hypothetical protein
MPISQVIADFKGALDDARHELALANAKVDELKVERARVSAEPPHTDDIVAAFMRGLRQASNDFAAQLQFYLNDANATAQSAAASAAKSAAQLLTTERQKPDHETLFPPSALMRPEVGLSTAALTYFLRDKLEAEIPVLVDRFCPAARAGMKFSDRQRLLGDLDAEIAEMEKKAKALYADIAAARAAVIR